MYLCVFFCIQLHWLGVKSVDVSTTFTASTLYCEYWQLWRTFRCAHLSQMEWILFKCRVSQLCGRKEGKEITDATVSHFYGRFWQELHIFFALDVIRIHLNAGTSRIQNCKHSVFVSVFLYLFSRIFVHIYIIYRLSTSHLWQVTFRPVKIHIGLQPPFCTIRIRKDNSNQLHLMCNVCVDSKARFQGKFNISIYR